MPTYKSRVLDRLAEHGAHEALLFELAADGRDYLSAETVALSEGIDSPAPEEAADALLDVLYTDGRDDLREEFRDAFDWRSLDEKYGDQARVLVRHVTEPGGGSGGAHGTTIIGDGPAPNAGGRGEK